MKDFIENLTKKQKIIIASIFVILFIIIFIISYRYFYSEENIQENNEQTEIEQNQLKENIVEEFEHTKSKEKVVVHVIGEIKTPGVVELNEGARIIDAIYKCGGTTENADLSKVNLAYILEDGVQIYIPRINENQEDAIIKEEPGEGVITEAETQEGEKAKQIKVNINTANEEKLKTLPGVGDSMAKKIIDYREKNGQFKKIEDIKNVSGIGENKFNNIKEYLTVK